MEPPRPRVDRLYFADGRARQRRCFINSGLRPNLVCASVFRLAVVEHQAALAGPPCGFRIKGVLVAISLCLELAARGMPRTRRREIRYDGVLVEVPAPLSS